jgi:hypothetical protein
MGVSTGALHMLGHVCCACWAVYVFVIVCVIDGVSVDNRVSTLQINPISHCLARMLLMLNDPLFK